MRFVPSQRFLLLTAVAMPLALLGQFSEGLDWLMRGYLVFLVLLAWLDLAKSSSLFSGLRISCDPIVRLSRDSEAGIDLHLKLESMLPAIKVGLPLPVAFVQESPTQTVRIPNLDTKRWKVGFPVRARSRGVFPCPDVFVEMPSRLGLFAMRKAFPVQAEIRVYPNLRRERKQLANLFLNRGNIGAHAQRMVGQGREYAQLRQYAAGDSMLDIHWKASAKRGELVTKTYQVERTQEVYLVIDHSRLSGLSSMRSEDDIDDDYTETILERYVAAASVMSAVADREGDLFGMIAYGHQVSRFVRASSGKQHSQVVQDALFNLNTDPGPFDLSEVLTFIRTRIRRRALVIFLTDLGDSAAAEEFERHIGLIASAHYVVVNSIRRPGTYPLYAEKNVGEGSTIASEIAGHLRWTRMRELQGNLRSQGVEFTLVDDDRLTVDLVNQYLNLKQRQVL